MPIDFANTEPNNIYLVKTSAGFVPLEQISRPVTATFNGDSKKIFRYVLLCYSDDKRKRRRARRWLNRDKIRRVAKR